MKNVFFTFAYVSVFHFQLCNSEFIFVLNYVLILFNRDFLVVVLFMMSEKSELNQIHKDFI